MSEKIPYYYIRGNYELFCDSITIVLKSILLNLKNIKDISDTVINKFLRDDEVININFHLIEIKLLLRDEISTIDLIMINLKMNTVTNALEDISVKINNVFYSKKQKEPTLQEHYDLMNQLKIDITEEIRSKLFIKSKFL